MPTNATILGAAGEHYVMHCLLRKNFIAALAPTGVPNADIIVSDDLGSRLFAMQVKVRSGRGSDGGWHMKEKHEKLRSENLFYCFVDFGSGLQEAPKCWIVPSVVVAEVLQRSHACWLAQPGARGVARNDCEMRRFLPSYEKWNVGPEHCAGWLDKFADAWEQLEQA